MTTESQIRRIISYPYDYEWSIQGFGMLRTWINPDGIERLHIWDTDLANSEVSTIHNHPWDFESRIVHGRILNHRYNIDRTYGESYRKADIKTGEGGGLLATHSTPTLISEYPFESYYTGDHYAQDADEFHESEPDKGTVTIIRRNFRHNRIATVCWRENCQWVTAEPRPATKEEIDRFIGLIKLPRSYNA